METLTTTTTAQTITKTTTVDFAIISYAKLAQGDADELASLRKVCEQDGFFYLDLRIETRESISAVCDVPSVFKIVNEFFELKNEEKLSYDVDEIGPWKLNGCVLKNSSGSAHSHHNFPLNQRM